jgi:hypothetical protein
MTSSAEGAGPGGDPPGTRLEPITDDTWREFTAAPFAVLLLATTSCPICKKWTAELSEWLSTDLQWPHVRFGKLNLNTDQVSTFKEENQSWLSDLPGVPFSVFFVRGERRADLPGRGVLRLVRRLERVQAEAE